MKKSITLIFCLFSALASAQISQATQAAAAPIIPPPQNSVATLQVTDVPYNWTNMLANLPVSQITSGVLLNKITDFSNLTNFNTAEKNLSDAQHFNQALSELYKASDQSRFISATTLASRTAYSTNTNSVDIGVINTLFHRLNFNEDDVTLTGLTYTNNQYAVVAGKPSFVSKKILVASPLKEFVSGSSVNFNFNDTFIFNNATTLIKKLTVKFDNNTTNAPITIINNSAFVLSTKNIVYTTSGYKTLQFTTTFTDNTSITTYAKIHVTVTSSTTTLQSVNSTNNLCTDTLRDRGVFTATETDNSTAFQGYDESYAFKGKIEYTVFYSYTNNARQMLKPIIIVDGFDPNDKRKVQDCDCENDPTCYIANSVISVNFSANPIVQVTYNPAKHVSIEDSMEYQGFTSTGTPIQANFLNDLRTLGYDVIVINQPTYQITNPLQPTIQVWVPTRLFPTFIAAHWETRPNLRTIDGGADYIERNAYTLASFIKNYVKPLQNSVSSTQQLVLIGPSMGGQITRYALAYMEKKFAQTGDINWKHNARLWVSVDSPHLGANIPVGAQANIWFMADPTKMDKWQARDSYAELNSVAGKQQSISNFEHARTTPARNLLNSPFYSNYYNNVNANGVAGSNGYPVSVPSTFRKIAMTNGSLTGAKQGVEGQSFLYTRIYIRGLWPFQSSTITLARFHDYFTPATGNTGLVFDGDGQNFNIGFNHWDTDHQYYSLTVNNQDPRGSLDVVPGGFFKFGETLKKSIEGGASDGGFRSETNDYVFKNSFISAFSALGHLNPWQSWSNPLNYNLACSSNKQTPFDSYYGEASNTEHTTFTNDGVKWLKKELANDPQAPWFPINQNALEGSSSVCFDVNTVFTINNYCAVPSSVLYTNQNGNQVNGWSVEGNISIVSSTAYSITVKGTSYLQGSGKIIASFQNGQTIEKLVYLGIPKFPTSGYVTGPTSVNYNQTRTYTYSGGAPVGATSNYQWYINAPINDGGGPTCAWQILTGQGTPTITVKTGCIAATAAIDVRVSNNCGTDSRYMYVSISATGTGGGGSDPCATNISTFPNPITNTNNLEVSLTTPEPCGIANNFAITQSAPINNELKIYDFYGVLRYSSNFGTNSMTLTNINLVSGNYVLNIFTNKGEILRKILVVQ